MSEKKWSNHNFEWKHVDEVVLHFCKPCKKQTVIEIIKIILPIFIIEMIFTFMTVQWWIPLFVLIIIFVLLTTSLGLTIWYKLYRSGNNYLYMTSKRILFHGMEWLFKDYVKKISYENIRNVNYFTDSFFGKCFKYGSLEIQSSHGWEWDIRVYHIENWKMLTHYIDKVLHLPAEERKDFAEFDPTYFKNWKS